MVLGMVWAVLAVVWVELIRDGRHWLAHRFPKAFLGHYVHHRAYRQDWSWVSEKLYREAEWRNDVPEALTLVLAAVLLWGVMHSVAPSWGWSVGIPYALSFLGMALARSRGWATHSDFTHLPGAFGGPPTQWFVNRPYHWRHHFDNGQAYFGGTLTVFDRIMGTALSLKDKTVAVTGASGALGRALLTCLLEQGAKPLALTSHDRPILVTVGGEEREIPRVVWQVGQEVDLLDTLRQVDILILNHGVNVYGCRTPEAIDTSTEVNALSQWRMMELFLSQIKTNADIARKEVWVNTSEAEVSPALSPLYELSKRYLGELVTLRRLDAPCIIRKLILGPFKSSLNPYGVMSPQWVARQIIALAKRDFRDIVITINPLTYVLFPLKELSHSLYFRLFSRKEKPQSTITPAPH
ncbi:MAG: bifunctional sterol desaturase/short chain dehydrogenase [Thermostichales cyanobacterium HHBFW_bins_127]